MVKKAFLHILTHIPGEAWLTQSLIAKTQARLQFKEGGDAKWAPSPDELKAGISFINASLAHSKNEQFLWILLNIRDQASPVYGWPHHIVCRACNNRVTGNCQTEAEYFFPLLLHDLNDAFLREVVPLILPTLTSFGLILLGKAGIGKTPAAILLVMAVAGHIVLSRNLEGFIPGWRRSKQIDGFREQPGEIHIPVLLDDPNLHGINVEDLKSFLDVGENGLVDARYRAAKFVRNQCRVLLNNEWCSDQEPEHMGQTQISWKVFLAMFRSAVNDAPMPHVMAILKRASVIIAGDHAVYVRVASERQSQVIHCINSDGITQDWLKETHKAEYGHYKVGQHVKYAGLMRILQPRVLWCPNFLPHQKKKNIYAEVPLNDRWADEYDGSTQPACSATPRHASSSRPALSSPLIASPPSKQAKIDLADPEGDVLSPSHEDS